MNRHARRAAAAEVRTMPSPADIDLGSLPPRSVGVSILRPDGAGHSNAFAFDRLPALLAETTASMAATFGPIADPRDPALQARVRRVIAQLLDQPHTADVATAATIGALWVAVHHPDQHGILCRLDALVADTGRAWVTVVAGSLTWMFTVSPEPFDPHDLYRRAAPLGSASFTARRGAGARRPTHAAPGRVQ